MYIFLFFMMVFSNYTLCAAEKDDDTAAGGRKVVALAFCTPVTPSAMHTAHVAAHSKKRSALASTSLDDDITAESTDLAPLIEKKDSVSVKKIRVSSGASLVKERRNSVQQLMIEIPIVEDVVPVKSRSIEDAVSFEDLQAIALEQDIKSDIKGTFIALLSIAATIGFVFMFNRIEILES